MTSADLIRAARAAACEKAGVRVKVRLSDTLVADAKQCAADVGEPLGEWINKACRQHRAGQFASVAISENAEVATREASECFTVRAPAGMPTADIRQAVRLCCAWCAARRINYRLEIPARYILARD